MAGATADSHAELAGRRRRPGPAGCHRFCGVPAARRAAPGHDRPCRLYRLRRSRAGHDFGHNGRQVIRESIGFEGLLMSDDVSMDALSGSIAERTRAAVAAGCDVVLHCNGRMDEMAAVASAVPRAGRAGRAARGGRARGPRHAARHRLGRGPRHLCRPHGRWPAGGRTDGRIMTADSAQFRSRPGGRARRPTSRPWWSTSRGSKARSICCSRWRASRRSTSPRSRSWRWPTNISPSSRRRASCGSSLPPTIS